MNPKKRVAPSSQQPKPNKADQRPDLRLEQLGQQLGGMLNPDVILSTIVNPVGDAGQASCVTLFLRRLDDEADELAAQYLQPAAAPKKLPAQKKSARPVLVPFIYQQERIGHLCIEISAPERRLTRDSISQLKKFCQQAGAAVRVVRLMHDLRRAREKLVLTREEERRLLRRNLHDSIGPTLAALNLRSGSVRKLITTQPDVAVAQMAELRELIRSVITDIRRVVYNLRPPALDELGILSAIREQARQFSAEGLQVQVESPDPLPTLNAAVEVAAYRIVSEALTNVVRHAQARQCWVRLHLDEHVFYIEVCDDGLGLNSAAQAGVGLTSMRERATELGGFCSIEAGPENGTRVRARLPIRLDALNLPSQ